MSDIVLPGIVAAARQLRASMQAFAAACARVGATLRVVIWRSRRAPCPTCDGSLVAYDYPRDFAWCRCRRRWAFEEIVRGRR
jgi:hypothetical protein